MIVGAAGDHTESACGQCCGKPLGVVERSLHVRTELRLQRQLVGDRLGGDHVHQRPALISREDGSVDGGRFVGARKDHATARSAQRLVCGGGHVIRMWEWARV